MLPLNNKPFIEKDNNKLDNEWNKGLLLSIDNAYDTNVKKYSFAKLFHLILILCLVVTYTVLMIVVITHRISDDPPSSKIYYINGTVYEILTESFQDTSPKSENGLRFGDGVGDIKVEYYLYTSFEFAVLLIYLLFKTNIINFWKTWYCHVIFDNITYYIFYIENLYRNYFQMILNDYLIRINF